MLNDLLKANQDLVEYVKKLELRVEYSNKKLTLSEGLVDALDAYLPNSVKHYKEELQTLNDEYERRSNNDTGI